MENKPLTEQISDVQQSVDASLETLALLTSKVDALIQKENKPQPVSRTQKPNNKEILTSFIKKSSKYWKWFGNSEEFKKYKIITCSLGLFYLLFAILAVVFASVSLNQFFWVSGFEILCLIFGIILFTRCLLTSSEIEDDKLRRINIQKSDVSTFGLHYSIDKRKILPKLFLAFTLLFSGFNFVYVLVEKGTIFGLAACFEGGLFLTSIAFYFSIIALFSQYSVALYKGRYSNGENITLVHDPMEKNIMTIEEYEKKVPIF